MWYISFFFILITKNLKTTILLSDLGPAAQEWDISNIWMTMIKLGAVPNMLPVYWTIQNVVSSRKEGELCSISSSLWNKFGPLESNIYAHKYSLIKYLKIKTDQRLNENN